MFRISPRSTRRNLSHLNVTLPQEYNFLKEYPHCDFGPLRQECGCCYAYGPLKAMSHRFCRATGEKLLLSPQFVVACDLADNACIGGCERAVLYFMEQYGITDIDCHPWKHVKRYSHEFCSKCANGSTPRMYKAAYGSTSHYVGIEDIKKAIFTGGPVSASIAIDPEFTYYHGGIYRSSRKGYIEAGNHAVELVGWGVEKGVEYWLLLNQYGERWGDKGMMKIKMGSNEGLVESFVYAAEPLLDKNEN